MALVCFLHIKYNIKNTLLIQMMMASLWLPPWQGKDTLGQRSQRQVGQIQMGSWGVRPSFRKREAETDEQRLA